MAHSKFSARIRSPSPAISDGSLLGGRYRILEEIGRGGVAAIHRVLDIHDGRTLALKRLLSTRTRSSVALSLFEREFHTLAQLAHPRVVEVYDYQVTAEGAFYTMELLDGGDVQTLAPLDTLRACVLMRDVCSALSLLHSRRLVHRDISPRNIRCTSDGLAKLIDFGAMIPMGTSAQIVGTPPFCAPEVVQMQPLDARTDLYSLGATLYYALCGHHAYPARDFNQLRSLWQGPPPPCPSELGAQIPRTLDDLVMELVQRDPQSRPLNAAVVMERLSAIGGLPLDEQLVVSRAYLSTPSLVGRERKLAQLRDRLARAASGTGCAVMVMAERGMGRSRFLDASALEAKLLGSTVVRASAADARGGDYAAARALARQLLDARPQAASELAQSHDALHAILPALRGEQAWPPSGHSGAAERLRLQEALRLWIVELSKRHPLVFAIDDVAELDEPSTALLALLAHDVQGHAIALVATAQPGAGGNETGPLSLLQKLCSPVTLGALRPGHAKELLGSIFGEVSHLGFVSHRLHQISGGNPRDLMQLAQHLVDRGVARYHAGGWTLPAQIDAADLPQSMACALAERVEALGLDARELGQALALTPNDSWEAHECLALSARDRRGAMSALDALTAAGVLRCDNARYALRQPGWVAPLLSSLQPERKRALHARIAELFAARRDDFRVGQHLLWAEEHERALDILVEHARTTKKLTDEDRLAWARMLRTLPRDYDDTYRAALQLCQHLNRPEADRYALRTRMSSLLNAFGVPSSDLILSFLNQCVHDAGLDLYEQLPQSAPAERLQQMIAAAQARHDRLPERERVFTPLHALQPLAGAMIEALGVASNGYDRQLWCSVPSLQPLEPLSPSFGVLDRVRRAVGDRLAGRYERALEGYAAALARLEQPDQAGLPDSYHHGVRNGVITARALVQAAMGSSSVLDAADRLETPDDRLAPLRLRMIHCLWQGDGEGADRYRTAFELASVQTSLALGYEGGLLFTELCALAFSDDLSRLRRIMPNLERWATRVPSWRPMLHYAQGEQRRIGGNFARALECVRQGLTLATAGDHQLWPMLAGAELQCLLELGRAEDAASTGRRYRQLVQEHGIDYPALYIDMPLSLSLAQVGELESAERMADTVVDSLARQGTAGVPLGVAFHNVARIALMAQDVERFRSAAARCAEFFEHSSNQALASKYRRLMREARRVQRRTTQDVKLITDMGWDSELAQTYLTTVFEGCAGAQERARIIADVLSKCCKAEKVFVYSPDEEQPALIATLGSYEAPAQLPELVSDLLAAERGQAMDATVTESEDELDRQAPAQDRQAPALWTSPDGEHYHALVLGHGEAHGYVITAVAVIALEAGTSFVHPHRLTTELSRLGMHTEHATTPTVPRDGGAEHTDSAERASRG